MSIGEEGYDANGNDDAFNAEIPLRRFGQTQANEEQGSRAISEDGSLVVSETAEPLSPKAVNGLVNAFEWHKEPAWAEGKVSLISSGNSPTADSAPVISPSGRDIFFLTFEGLVAQDTDGAQDVYDARLGGGFPPPPVAARECEGDACQGPLTNPAALLVPGSVVQTPGESVVSSPKSKPKSNSKALSQKLARALRACRRRHGKSRTKCEQQTRQHKSTLYKGGK